MKKYIKNPLLGKVELLKEGIRFETGIMFSGEIKPKVRPREWFFLLENALKRTCEDEELLNDYKKVFDNWAGSSVTKWRAKKSLLEKGFILSDQ